MVAVAVIEFPFQIFSRNIFLQTYKLLEGAPKKIVASKLHDGCLLVNAISDKSVVNAVIKWLNKEEQVNPQFPIFFS